MKYDSDYTVYFGSSMQAVDRLPPGSILIAPTSDDWNDFGFKCHAIAAVKSFDRSQLFETRIFSSFIQGDEPTLSATGILPELESVGSVPVKASELQFSSFFSMLPDMSAYREVIQFFGPDESRRFLLAIRDVVALVENRKDNKWLEQVFKTEVFTQAFMRNSSSFYAYKNAGSVLKGLDFEELVRPSNSINVKFQMDGLRNPHSLTFGFDHEAEIPRRTAVVIGKNGVGKSQTLGRIARAALEGSETLTDAEGGGRVLANRILAFAPTNEMDTAFPRNNWKHPKIWYKAFSLNRSKRSTRGFATSDLIVQLARSEEYVGRSRRWGIFREAVKAVRDSEQLSLRHVGKTHHAVPLDQLIRGGEQQQLDRFSSIDVSKEVVRLVGGRVFPLSSGEVTFIRFAAQASLYIDNGSLLLIDEPETHLHPNFIGNFMSLLDGILASTGSAAVIATHSAFVVREVFDEQVSILRLDQDGDVVTQKPNLRTLGSDVGAISYFVFGEDEPSHLTDDIKHRLLERYSRWADLYEVYKGRLSWELLSELRSEMGENE